jgi:acyl-CoA dehydrogenase
MIDFEIKPYTREILRTTHAFCRDVVRDVSRYYDQYEHEHDDMSERELGLFRDHYRAVEKMVASRGGQGEGMVLTRVMLNEERSWGGCMGGQAVSVGLGNAAINAVATEEQKARFGRLKAAMAITEPSCGSDTAAIQTTARLDPESREWILNGEKIFVTSGKHCDAVVVWASLDRSKGRPAIKSFVVEKDRPGVSLSKLEDKLGIRASDTASIVLEDCRIPYDNILGSPEIMEKKGGFRGVMATFDATRPGVAAMAVGVARAALDFTREQIEQDGTPVVYNRPVNSLTAVQRDILQMEATLDAARLLVWRAAAMLDRRERNSKEASMAKAKAGKAAGEICQRCVALLGPLGYSRQYLVEKWMRDCKITDLFEGTGQINMLIVARNILGFSRHQLK